MRSSDTIADPQAKMRERLTTRLGPVTDRDRSVSVSTGFAGSRKMAGMQKMKGAVAADPPADKSARARILETATELFYREGIRAVGIDTIIARSGVAKMSLYRNFASKDDLVVAFLEYRDGIYWQWWDHVMAGPPPHAPPQNSELFPSLALRGSRPPQRGRPFIRT